MARVAGDAWRPWPIASPEQLAHYVSHDAVRDALPDDFFRNAEGGSLEQMAESGAIVEVVGILYERMRALGIEYGYELVSLDRADAQQRIRSPRDLIARKKGTCLDLAMFFCGVCIEARLLPMPVLLRPPNGGGHALVVVETRNIVNACDKPSGWSKGERDRGVISGPEARDLWREGGRFAGRLWRGEGHAPGALVAYVAVECTGFVKLRAGDEVKDTMSFEAARDSAVETLGSSEHLATVNVAWLQGEKKNYRPYEVPAQGASDMRDDYIDAVRRTFCDLEFAGLSVEGASAHVLKPEQAFRGLRFTPAAANERTFGLAELADKRSAVITGPPGAGKSGTLKLLVDAAARDGRTLPVYLPLRELAGSAITPAVILDCLVRQAREQLGVAGATAEFFGAALKEGDCLLAFDALDELGDAATRKRAVLALRALADSGNKNGKLRMYVTSRPDEYHETPLPQPGPDALEFAQYSLEPFGAEDIRAYLRTCFADDGALADAILGRSDLAALAQGPLQVGLLAIVLAGGQVPEGRFALFDTFVNTALESWERLKGREDNTPAAEARRPALERLAWELQERAGTSAPLVQGEAHALLVDFKDAAGAAVPAAALLEWLARRTGLLRVSALRGRVATRTLYDFVHPQLREFLAGCDLAARLAADFDRAFAGVDRRLFDHAWRDVLRFAVAKLSQTPGAHDRLLKAILDAAPPYESLLHRKALLAADLMGHGERVNEALEKRVVDGLSAIASGECCKAREAIGLLISLAWAPRARAAIRSIAVADAAGRAMIETVNQAPWMWDSDDLRAWAVLAICEHGEPQEAAAVLEKAWRELKSPPAKLQLAQGWTMLGQAERARHELLDMHQAAEEDHGQILDQLVKLGFRADAVAAERARLQRARGDEQWRCAEWLWSQGALDASSAELCAMFEEACRLLTRHPTAYDVPNELNSAWFLGLSLEAAGTPHAAADFMSAARVHPEFVWRAAMAEKPFWVEPRLLQAFLAVVKDESTDSSRVRIMVQALAERGDELVVPMLLELLRVHKTLLWAGEDLVAALARRGRSAEAIAALEEVQADPQAGYARERAGALLLQLRPLPVPHLAAFEKELDGLDERQAAMRVMEFDKSVGGGPTVRQLLWRLSSTTKGKAILEALLEPISDSHRLPAWALDTLLAVSPLDEAVRRAKEFIARRDPDGFTVAMLCERLGEHGRDDEAVGLLEGVDRREWSLTSYLAGLPERGNRERAVGWAQRMLASPTLPAATKFALAHLLMEWNERPVPFTIPAQVLDETLLFVDENPPLSPGMVFAVLHDFDAAAARQAFEKLLARGVEDADVAVHAVRTAGHALPWRQEWSDLLATIAGRAAPEHRCAILEQLEMRV